MNGIHVATIGRVSSEPELKYTATAKAVLNFSVGVFENRPNGDGAEATWLRVACWEQLAEDLAERLHKGDEVYLEGRLKLNTWTAQDGTERTNLNVSAWKVEPLGHIGRRASKREAVSA
jgi:single-strand DNA-binding protein